MITASISETRRRLTQLIERARQGEDVVIMKDSRPVAALRAIGPQNLELKLEVSEEQARRLWSSLKDDDLATFDSAKKAVGYLKRSSRARK